MAENQGGSDRDTDDLSEEASPHRLEQMRKKGRVNQSREVTGGIVLLAIAVATFTLSSQIGDDVATLMKEVFSSFAKANILPSVLLATISKSGKVLMLCLAPVAAVAVLSALFGSVSQVGFIFSAEPLTPDFDRINPINGLQRMFSMRQFKEFLRVFFKTLFLGVTAYFLIKGFLPDTTRFALMDIRQLAGAYSGVAKTVFFTMILILGIFAATDFWLQRRDFLTQVKVTKPEAKQEQKEQEGDPMTRNRIRTIQREMARKRMMQAVKKADVIVTNPTHIAIAIVYDKGKMAAPRVVAKGADFLAQNIKKIAADAGVPLVENVPLARALFKSVKVGQYVPRNLYQAIAEVLAYVYKLKNKKW